MRTVALLVTLSVVFCSARGVAEPPAAPDLVATARFLLGRWTCGGVVSSGPFGQRGAATSSISYALSLRDTWLSAETELRLTETRRPVAVTVRSVLGYDPSTKQLVGHEWDSTGGFAQMSASGWQGDRLVLAGEGVVGGQRVKLRRTIVREGEGGMTSLWEQAGSDGAWTSVAEQICKRPRTPRRDTSSSGSGDLENPFRR